MLDNTIPDGGEGYMRRALHFARREMDAHRGELPISVTQLSMFLLFRAGLSAAEIAATIEMDQRRVAKRLMGAMCALGAIGPQHRARVEALCAEMGLIKFEPRAGAVVKFPGPSRLATRQYIVEVAS